MKRINLNQADQAIDTVLDGLRHADARAGMNDRILAALAEQAAAPVRSGWRLGIPSRLRPVYASGFAFAGAAVVALILFGLHRPVSSRSETKLQATTSRPRVQADEEIAPGKAMVRESDVRISTGRNPSMRGVVATRPARPETADDAHAASFPAPPMPLTEQERLLLAVIHRNDPVEMAMLNPEERSRQEAQGKDDFVRFFDPSAAAGAKKN